MDSLDDIRLIFFQECEDLLGELETGLNEINDGGADSEVVNAVFRAVHSIKGGAGAFGLDYLVKFAHTFETVLDEVRGGRLDATPDLTKLLLRSADALADLVHAARDDAAADEAHTDALLEQLSELAGIKHEKEAAPAADIDFQPMALDFSFDDDDEGLGGEEEDGPATFEVTFRPHASLYQHANESVVLLHNLAELGKAEIVCDASGLPALDEVDPEGAYLSWTIRLETEADEDDIRSVFEFADGDCDLFITKERSRAESAPEPFNFGDEGAPAAESEESAPKEAVSSETEARASEPANDEKPRRAAAGAPVAKNAAAPDATIRVSLTRVDSLVNLVGELVINQSMIAQGVQEAGSVRGLALETGLEELKQLTREIQESVMAIRAQPVKTLFQRMSRICREAGDATKKSVRLVTEGETTEVDKTVIERLADPLTHMIRNAVDHGLESPEKRRAAGKPAEGVVRLSASHRSGRVVIEVSDDGAGINRERVRSIAVEKGLIPENAQLSENEVDNLLFMPGFSTAKEISNLSGRGVGLDVVKRAIQDIGGRVSIASQPGQGTTFTITLPLTLAILDGMIVEIGNQALVVPLSTIVEMLRPNMSEVHPLGGSASVVSIRGELTPIIDIGHELGYRAEPTEKEKGVLLCVETESGARAALLVDAIRDQRQVVIKSLEENYGSVPGIAAATILGDGKIALIVDVETIVERAGRWQKAACA